jgi:hypothetical protein
MVNHPARCEVHSEDYYGDEEEETEIGYLAFKGDFIALNARAVSGIEAAANARDLVVRLGLTNGGQQSLGQ